MANQGITNQVFAAAAAINLSALTTFTGKYAQFLLANIQPWSLNSINFTLTTTATAGTRQPCFAILDANNRVLYIGASVTGQAASLTGYHNFGGGRTPVNSNVQCFEGSLPDQCMIPCNSKILFWDRLATDALDTVSLYTAYTY